MSIIVQVFPQCDRCKETYPDSIVSTVRDCRRLMVGWKRIKGQDVCPDCLGIEKRKAAP